MAAKAPRLETLDAPRYIASIHIVLFHYFGYENYLVSDYFILGGMWTQFFFILAGFVLGYAEMARPASKAVKMTKLQYLRKRLITIYPLYALSVCLYMSKAAVEPSCGCDWEVLPLHLLLLQGVVQVSCCAPYEPWNGEAWFLSALVVYWLMTLPLCSFFRNTSTKSCYAWLFCLWALSLALWPLDMLLGGHWLSHGVLGYIHVYIAGVVMARVFIATCMVDVETGEVPRPDFQKLTLDTGAAPWVLRYGCVLGYALWAALAAGHLFVYPLTLAPGYLILHNGGMLPIMLLILGGGAAGVDPLANRVFRWRPFIILARLSFSQYILQGWVNELLWRHSWGKAAEVPILLVAAYLAQRFVERPFTDWQRQRAQSGILGWDDCLIQGIDGAADRAKAAVGTGLACGMPRKPHNGDDVVATAATVV